MLRGLDVPENIRASGAGTKMFLDIPFIEQALARKFRILSIKSTCNDSRWRIVGARSARKTLGFVVPKFAALRVGLRAASTRASREIKIVARPQMPKSLVLLVLRPAQESKTYPG